MSVLWTLWRKAASDRSRLAAENQQLRHDLAVARAQHVSDGRRIDDLEHHAELMACDNADLERTVEAYTAGLRWFAEKEGST